jgi:galactose mutarotase-like enzyme
MVNRGLPPETADLLCTDFLMKATSNWPPSANCPYESLFPPFQETRSFLMMKAGKSVIYSYKDSMNSTASPSPTARTVRDGFEVLLLRSCEVELAVVPELGAKVVSLRNLNTGREWMYFPGEKPSLFKNEPGDDFARSPLVGWDECLPSISPCHWQGRSLPDHGEVWSAAWKLNEEAWKQGIIETSVRLPVSPLLFCRRLELRGGRLHVDYQLTNLGNRTEEFIWAMHPLLALHEGDRLVLSPEIRGHLGQHSWIDTLDFCRNVISCAKVFAGPLKQGNVAVYNPMTGDKLSVGWDASDCDTLGLWLTRGGWHGHHHLALEPANGAPDSLAVAATEWKRCCYLEPHSQRSWSVQITVEPA